MLIKGSRPVGNRDGFKRSRSLFKLQTNGVVMQAGILLGDSKGLMAKEGANRLKRQAVIDETSRKGVTETMRREGNAASGSPSTASVLYELW